MTDKVMRRTGAAADQALAACREAVLGYHDEIDRGRATAALRYVADGAQFEMRGEHLDGEQLARFLQQREDASDRHTAHIFVHERVLEQSARTVRLGARLLVHARDGAGDYVVERVIDVTHELTLTDRGWLIARRTSSPLHPLPAPAAGTAAAPTAQPEGTPA